MHSISILWHGYCFWLYNFIKYCMQYFILYYQLTIFGSCSQSITLISFLSNFALSLALVSIEATLISELWTLNSAMARTTFITIGSNNFCSSNLLLATSTSKWKRRYSSSCLRKILLGNGIWSMGLSIVSAFLFFCSYNRRSSKDRKQNNKIVIHELDEVDTILILKEVKKLLKYWKTY